jgi:hypothetical protein
VDLGRECGDWDTSRATFSALGPDDQRQVRGAFECGLIGFSFGSRGQGPAKVIPTYQMHVLNTALSSDVLGQPSEDAEILRLG